MVEPIQNPTQEDIASWHRTFAPMAFNGTWSLLDLVERTRVQDEEMLASTFAQRYHWYQVGTPRHHAVADWQVSRVGAVLGLADLARRFGERSLAVCIDNNLDAFVTGFAHEAIARAAADVDDVDTFTEHLQSARDCLDQIEDAADREVLASDLAEMSDA